MSDNMNEFFGEPGEVPIKAVGKLAEKIAKAKDPVADEVKAKRKAAGKAARALGKVLEAKTIEHYQSQGYMAFSVGYTTHNPVSGASYAKDLLGVADAMAVMESVPGGYPQIILIQSTTEDRRTAHELKLIDPKNLDVRTGKSAYQNLLDWLDHGGEFDMVLWEKKMNRWQPRVVAINKAWLIERHEAKYGRKK